LAKKHLPRNFSFCFAKVAFHFDLFFPPLRWSERKKEKNRKRRKFEDGNDIRPPRCWSFLRVHISLEPTAINQCSSIEEDCRFIFPFSGSLIWVRNGKIWKSFRGTPFPIITTLFSSADGCCTHRDPFFLFTLVSTREENEIDTVEKMSKKK
jgi:hypothetical protein